jgi:hypothetical protein
MVGRGVIPLALRREGLAWRVGRAIPRTIGGRDTIELRDGKWYSTAREAVEALERRSLALLTTPGPHVRALRGKRSRAAVAREAGVSVRQIQRIEAGTSDPKAITLARLLAAL